MPIFCLAVGDLDIWIASEDIIHGDSNECGYSLGGNQAQAPGEHHVLLGANFLKNVYAVLVTPKSESALASKLQIMESQALAFYSRNSYF